MQDFKKYEKDFLTLVEGGFIAVNQFDEDAAIKLFKAAELLNPKNYLSKIGYGYLHLHKLELKSAAECFKSVLNSEPENEMAKTFLGITLSMMPKELNKGENLLMETVKSKDKLIKKLSDTALDFIDNFIKKDPTPLEVQKKKKG